MQPRNSIRDVIVDTWDIFGCNTKVECGQYPEKVPEERHGQGVPSTALIDHSNSRLVVTMYDNVVIGPSRTPMPSCQINGKGFLVCNMEGGIKGEVKG